MSYSGNSVVNRAQMARMTNTAIYDVEMPDSRKLIDVVNFNVKDEFAGKEGQNGDEGQNGRDEQHEKVYENVDFSVSASKALLPVGGGQTTQINVYVTHNDLPAAGVPVGFFANLVTNVPGVNDDRNNQLSSSEAVTDATGKATVTYTTLAADDNKHIGIKANTRDDDAPYGWTDKGTYIMASNDASLCQGRIVNPFTGEAQPNVKIDFKNMATNNYFWFENISDKDGYYSVVVPTGKYYIGFYLDLGDAIHYSGSYTGSHHGFKDDNTMVLRINEKQIDKNKTYTLDTEMGIIKGVVSNLGSHRNLYIHNGTVKGTFIANVKKDGSFMIAVPEDNYEINAQGGHILKQNVSVKKGKVIDLGKFSR